MHLNVRFQPIGIGVRAMDAANLKRVQRAGLAAEAGALELVEVDGVGAAGAAGVDFVSEEPVLVSCFDSDLESFGVSELTAAGASPPSAFLAAPLPA